MIRRATAADAAAIQQVARITWPATYAGHIDAFDIQDVVERWYAPEMVARSIARLGAGYKVYERDGGIIAYSSSGPDRELQPTLFSIYVLPEFQGTGIGWELWLAAIHHLTSIGATTMDLLVLRENERARRFYERQGAREIGSIHAQIGASTVMEIRYRLQLLTPDGRTGG